MGKQKFDYNWQEKESFVEIEAFIFDTLKPKQQKELKSFDYHTSHHGDEDSEIIRYTFLLPKEIEEKYKEFI